MSQILLVLSAGHRGNGLTSISLGLVRALQRRQARVGFCKPVAQPGAERGGSADAASALALLTTGSAGPAPLSREEVEALLSDGDAQTVLEGVVARCQEAAEATDALVVEGLVPMDDAVYSASLNTEMAQALDARVVLVAAPEGRGPDEVAEALALAVRTYGLRDGALLGAVLNKVPSELPAARWRAALEAHRVPLLGAVPYDRALAAPRVSDVARDLGAQILQAGDQGRRVERVVVAAMTLPNVLERGARPGTLLITPGDRLDTLLGAALTELSGARLGGVLLSGGLAPPPEILSLCRQAPSLPILSVETDSFETARAASALGRDLPGDDAPRAERVVEAVADALDARPLLALLADDRPRLLTPPAFRHALIQRARSASRRIVLPEGDEPRTVSAAAICARRGLARCVLLGDPERIRGVARALDIALPEGVEILDPAAVRGDYVEPLCTLRRHKGLNPQLAAEQLEDNVVLGTVMLKLGEVDGLVSGAVHTTANTIRPALQLIKTAPGYSLVSSVFFMCLPHQVLVYGDCAVNPSPTPPQLAEIAAQSAETAAAFGVEPRIAMISYATGASAGGDRVQQVAEATRLARGRVGAVPIDGPLQYDAASVASVGRAKAPDSDVAGRATIFIFPDLNTGNTTYKAVQRAAGVVSVGPVLQGLDMPVNDLSRGCLIEDIVFTIAITAIQAAQREARVDRPVPAPPPRP